MSKISDDFTLQEQMNADLKRDYTRNRLALFCGLGLLSWLLFTEGESTEFLVIVNFAILVDLMGIRRCQRLCRLLESHRG